MDLPYIDKMKFEYSKFQAGVTQFKQEFEDNKKSVRNKINKLFESIENTDENEGGGKNLKEKKNL